MTLPPAPPGVQVTHEYGIEFATVNAAAAPPITGAQTLADPLASRVRHEFPLVATPPAPFRIARTELTTASWADFLSTFTRQYSYETLATMDNGRWTWMVDGPVIFGGALVPAQSGVGNQWVHGFNGRVNTSLIAVQGISLVQGAMYCNWLQNGQQSNFGSLMTGAYDLTGIVGTQTGILHRSAGAQFFIPSLDEWLVAAHYDPNRNGQGQGGYWEFPTTSDTAPIYGPPGIGQANAGFERFDDGYDPGGIGLWAAAIGVGSYPTVQSPWGLLDTAGGAFETLESLGYSDSGTYLLEGSRYGNVDGFQNSMFDMLGYYSEGQSLRSGSGGLRIAAVVPAPVVLPALGMWCTLRTRRRR